jgi:hypothetical protein
LSRSSSAPRSSIVSPKLQCAGCSTETASATPRLGNRLGPTKPDCQHGAPADNHPAVTAQSRQFF